MKHPLWPEQGVLWDLKNPHIQIGLLFYLGFTLLLWVLIGNVWAAIGFALAAYAVIWNDALQTLMTFMHSNSDIPKKYLYVWAASVLTTVLWYGFVVNSGDISYGRLWAKGYADISIEWYVVFLPLVLVFLTRIRGVPISTSLLILSAFSTSGLFGEIVVKSLSWYVIAFFSAFFLWLIAESLCKKFFIEPTQEHAKKSLYWRIFQSATTILLFATWLTHEMVVMAVFLPSDITIEIMVVITAIFLLWLAYTFSIWGGPIKTIITKKASTHQLITATMIDLVFFIVLLVFKEWSNIPMGTTWVFIGLLAGRQFAIRFVNRIDTIEWHGRMRVALSEAWSDMSKLLLGLWVAVVLLLIFRSFM